MKLKRVLLPVLLIAALICVLPLGASAETFGDYEYSIVNDTVTIDEYKGTESNVVIPDTIDGKPVTVIGQNAFWGNRLSKVTIPKSVTTIQYGAFENCWFLGTVTFPAESVLTTIGNGAFEGTGNLLSVTLPDSVTSIGKYCFKESSVQKVKLSSGMKEIPWQAFSECKRLKTVEIPNGITTIGENAFYNCTALTEVSLPNTVTDVGERAFYCCESVAALKLSSQLTSIKDYSFYNMDAVTTLVIPDGVTSIGEGAFGAYESLKTVTIPKSVTSIATEGFWLAEFDTVHYKGTMSEWAAVSVGDKNGNLKEKLAHTWDASGNTCTVCGFACQHTGGTATCISPAACRSCGYGYGQVNGDNHASTETFFAKSSETQHTQYHTCCNQAMAATAHSVNQPGDRVATCTVGAYCHLCNNYYGEKDADNHESTETHYSSVDKAQHALRHSCCDQTIEKKNHTLEDGICTVCGRRFNVVITHGTATCGYNSVSAALADAKDLDGCTVSLHRYSEGMANGYTVEKGNFTIDLNGSSLSSSNNDTFTVKQGARLTITDSSADGNGYIKAQGSEFALMVDGGEVCVRGGHLKESYNGAIYSAYLNHGKLSLEGGTVDGIMVNQSSGELYISGDKPNSPRTCWINFLQRDIVDWLPRVQISQMLTGDDTYTFRSEVVGNVVASGIGGYILTEADAARFANMDNSLVVTLNETDNTLYMKGDLAAGDVTLTPDTFTYDGNAHMPAVKVIHNVRLLTEHTDYTVSCKENINAGTATVTVTGKGNYVGTKTATFTINKADAPAIQFPAVKNSITYGQQLQDAELSFCQNSYGTFRWENPTSVPNAGTGDYALDFYPDDLALQNYDWKDAGTHQWNDSRKALWAMSSVSVEKAAMERTDPVPNDLTYTGQPQPLAREGSWENRGISGHFHYATEENGTYTATMPEVTAAGAYTLWYKPDNADSQNYLDLGPWHVQVTVKKAVPDYIVPTGLTVTKGQPLAEVSLPAGWAWEDDTASAGTVGTQTYKAVFTPTDTDNYNTVSTELPVAVCPDLSALDQLTVDTVDVSQKEELQALLREVQAASEAELPQEKAQQLAAAQQKLQELLTCLPPYKLTAGDGSEWVKNSALDLTFAANGHFNRFTGIKVDGNALDRANYTAASGSTVVTLKGTYLQTLSRGMHTIEVCYDNGSAVGSFRIVRTGGSPDTADPAQPMLYLSLLTLSTAALYLSLRKRITG